MLSLIHCNNVTEPKVYLFEDDAILQAKEKLADIFKDELIKQLNDCRSSFISKDGKYAVVDSWSNISELFLINVTY